MAYLNRLTLIDSNGHVYDSIEDIHGDYHIGVAIIQDINQDPNNTSTANLASGATFTGTGTSIPGVGIINVILKADQNCTVYIDQAGDGVNYDITDSYYYVANTGQFGVPVQVVGQLYRVRVTNTGPSTTTTFRLEANLVPVGSPLPRTLDPYQNLKVGLNALRDQYGYLGQFDAAHNLAVEEPYHLVGIPFIGTTVDTNFWTVANNGAGSVADTGATTLGLCTLSSGTATSGYGSITSVRIARFVFGVQLKYRAMGRVTNVTVAGCTRSWGAMTISGTPPTPQAGFYFSLSPTGVLSVNTAYSGSVTTVNSGSFNGLISQYTLDTNAHIWEIQYFQASAQFFIDGVLIHSITPTTSPMTSTLHLPASAFSENASSGTVASGTLQGWAVAILRLGRPSSSPITHYFSGATAGTNLKIGPGVVHRVCLSVPASAATANVVTLYDNTAASGTILWTSGSLLIGGGAGSFNFPVAVELNLPFFTGLEVLSTEPGTFTVIYE